jgi:hypothetical protein
LQLALMLLPLHFRPFRVHPFALVRPQQRRSQLLQSRDRLFAQSRRLFLLPSHELGIELSVLGDDVQIVSACQHEHHIAALVVALARVDLGLRVDVVKRAEEAAQRKTNKTSKKSLRVSERSQH